MRPTMLFASMASSSHSDRAAVGGQPQCGPDEQYGRRGAHHARSAAVTLERFVHGTAWSRLAGASWR